MSQNGVRLLCTTEADDIFMHSLIPWWIQLTWSKTKFFQQSRLQELPSGKGYKKTKHFDHLYSRFSIMIAKSKI